MKNFGFIQTEFDGTEQIYMAPQSIEIPEEFSYMNNLPKVIDQGEDSICVPCSIAAFINWDKNLIDGIIKDNEVDLSQIFENRSDKENYNGMTFKDALTFIKNEGVNTKDGLYKIKQYARVTSLYALKYAIFMNGPCLGGLPVYNMERDFWNKNYSDDFQGLHAVSIVGYTKDSFIIRNSWGTSYGIKGYYTLKYEDINKFVELWTII